ncbi:unnamed protein product [Tetraodon nigroviridis]|uniref:(spotted green pufferfish) hypothetical protein n=1 Tax=Tetraodon nigroviridis TaxID=99883 RepID=Q4SUF9_TETNG|nr:unnamed protein product [Tetraodon nigroviridis]
MVKPEEASTPSGWRPPTPPPIHHSLPSPSLCCACGLCTMLAGINVTLVGVLTFGSGNVTIIVGPLLLLVAAALFVGCCVVSRSRAHVTGGGRRGQQWGRMQGATVALEMETSEHTLQDTTAVQLSPPHSTSSSHKSNSSRNKEENHLRLHSTPGPAVVSTGVCVSLCAMWRHLKQSRPRCRVFSGIKAKSQVSPADSGLARPTP